LTEKIKCAIVITQKQNLIMKHFLHLAALMIADWTKRDQHNANLPKGAAKFGGWLGPQREHAFLADRIEEMHQDRRPYYGYGKGQSSRCSYYLFTDKEFVNRILTSPAREEFQLFIRLPRRARETVLNWIRAQYAAKKTAIKKKGKEVVT